MRAFKTKHKISVVSMSVLTLRVTWIQTEPLKAKWNLFMGLLLVTANLNLPGIWMSTFLPPPPFAQGHHNHPEAKKAGDHQERHWPWTQGEVRPLTVGLMVGLFVGGLQDLPPMTHVCLSTINTGEIIFSRVK